MKKIYSICLFLLASTILTFAGNDETRSLDKFNTISVAGSVKVILVKGNSNKAEIETVNASTDDLITSIKNGQLKIKFKDSKGKWINNKKAIVTLTYRNIEGISAAAGSSVKSDDILETGDLYINVSSGAMTKLEVQTSELRLSVSSGGSLILEGQADEADVDVSSGGSINGRDLKAQYVKATASSGGAAKVWAVKSFKANASSGGTVKYKGDPSKTEVNSGYSGSIKKMM
jgi:hypothetical protein